MESGHDDDDEVGLRKILVPLDLDPRHRSHLCPFLPPPSLSLSPPFI